jgi:site-specific DNA recombinase
MKKKFGKHDTPYLLRRLIHCRRCNTLLQPKDQSPAKSKNKYMYYCCPDCQQKVALQTVHTDLFSRLQYELEQQILKSKQYIQKLLNNWNRQLTKHLNSVETRLKIVENHERLLQRNHPHYDFMCKAYTTTRTLLLKEQSRIVELLNKVKLLESENADEEFFNRFWNLDLGKLSQVELRTLCLTFIEKILIDLHNNNRISVHFYCEPFSSLNEIVGQITEKSSNMLV